MSSSSSSSPPSSSSPFNNNASSTTSTPSSTEKRKKKRRGSGSGSSKRLMKRIVTHPLLVHLCTICTVIATAVYYPLVGVATETMHPVLLTSMVVIITTLFSFPTAGILDSNYKQKPRIKPIKRMESTAEEEHDETTTLSTTGRRRVTSPPSDSQRKPISSEPLLEEEEQEPFEDVDDDDSSSTSSSSNGSSDDFDSVAAKTIQIVNKFVEKVKQEEYGSSYTPKKTQQYVVAEDVDFDDSSNDDEIESTFRSCYNEMVQDILTYPALRYVFDRIPSVGNMVLFIISGLIFHIGFNALMHLGIHYASAEAASIIQITTTLFSCLFAMVAGKERFTVHKTLLAAAGILSVSTICVSASIEKARTDSSSIMFTIGSLAFSWKGLVGAVALITSSFCHALFQLILQHWSTTQRMPVNTALMWTNLFGSLFVTAAAAYFAATTSFAKVSLLSWITVLYGALVIGVVCTPIYAFYSRKASPAAMLLYHAIVPLLTYVVHFLLTKGLVSWYSSIGGSILIVLSLALAASRLFEAPMPNKSKKKSIPSLSSEASDASAASPSATDHRVRVMEEPPVTPTPPAAALRPTIIEETRHASDPYNEDAKLISIKVEIPTADSCESSPVSDPPSPIIPLRKAKSLPKLNRFRRISNASKGTES